MLRHEKCRSFNYVALQFSLPSHQCHIFMQGYVSNPFPSLFLSIAIQYSDWLLMLALSLCSESTRATMTYLGGIHILGGDNYTKERKHTRTKEKTFYHLLLIAS